jgi:hypothetical protein
MKVRFYSYGGSGLKFVSDLVSKRMDASDAAHSPHVFEDIADTDIDKAIILYGDPRDALLSFFGRGDPIKPLREFRNDPCPCGSGEKQKNCCSGIATASWLVRHVHHLYLKEPEKKPRIDPGMTLGEYLDTHDVDIVGLENFFMQWVRTKNTKPIAFLRYEALGAPPPRSFVVIEQLEQFLELEPGTLAEPLNAKFRPRRSAHGDCPVKYQEKLEKMFSNLLQEQAKLGDFFVK